MEKSEHRCKLQGRHHFLKAVEAGGKNMFVLWRNKYKPGKKGMQAAPQVEFLNVVRDRARTPKPSTGVVVVAGMGSSRSVAMPPPSQHGTPVDV